jgi:peptidoglycan/LPS O-acetylase OafA/YrhL
LKQDDRILALDGLRGIAILLVLFLHFTPDVALPWRTMEWVKKVATTGGWIGVDLFFVLSGFLITGILLRTKNEPGYFSNFYARRSLRIFPLYYGLLVIVFILLPPTTMLGGPSFESLRETQAYHWIYATNIGSWIIGGRPFSTEQINLLHLWSLSIEEQFYIFWPVIVFSMSKRGVLYTCVLLFISAPIFRCIFFSIDPEDFSAYYLTPCRWDGLAAGALVACLADKYKTNDLVRFNRLATIAALFGAGVLLIFFFVMKGLWAHHAFMKLAGFSIAAAMFAGLLILVVANPNGKIAKILAIKPLCFYGKYSYGLYVLHGAMMPAFLFLIPVEPWIAAFSGWTSTAVFSLTAIKIAASTALALLSWHFYEKQFLKLKDQFFPAPVKLETAAA